MKLKKTLSSNPLFKLEVVKDIVKTEKRHQILIGFILVLYLIFDVPIPEMISKSIDTNIGNAVIILLVFITFVASNPIVGILSLVVGYELIRRSRKQGHKYNQRYLPSENKKNEDFKKYNQRSQTLEETIIKNKVPIENKVSGKPSYSPILADQHSATTL